MNTTELLELNALGLIPGPSETKDEFVIRTNYCLQLKNNWKEFVSSDVSTQPLKKTKALFDISPDWVPVLFSDHQLMPWHGGSAWIFQENDESPTSAFFQLKTVFQRQQTYLKFYDRDELMAHEMSHIGRMMFEEPKFEELIAYQTSNSSFRRYFGSILQSSKESMVFMLLLLSTLFLDFFLIVFDSEEAFQFALIVKLLPLALILWGCLRLSKRHRQLSKAKENLESLVKSKEMVSAVIYRLQDKEIEFFSKATANEISNYIQEQTSLRWQLIVAAYLKR